MTFSEEFDDITCEVNIIQAAIDTLILLNRLFIACIQDSSL